jgi:hypothetical protein
MKANPELATLPDQPEVRVMMKAVLSLCMYLRPRTSGQCGWALPGLFLVRSHGLFEISVVFVDRTTFLLLIGHPVVRTCMDHFMF